jgi:hypothetical protein
MARIQIGDLPLLKDLTPEQLKELFGAGPKAFRPSFEALEERQLMSASSLLATAPLSTLSAATLQTGAQVASNLDQPIQIIPVDPIAPVAGAQVASNLDQPIQIIPVDPTAPMAITSNPSIQALPADPLALQTQAIPSAAVQQDMKIDPSFQPTDPGLAAAAFGSLNQPTQNVLDNSQNLGQRVIANKVIALGTSLGRSLNVATTNDFGWTWREDFEGGKSIIWSETMSAIEIAHNVDARIAGAHVVSGLIRDKYDSLGGLNWGYPKTDDVVLVNGLPGDVRVVNDFTLRGGGIASIVWGSHTANVGPQVIMGGAIWSAWVEVGATRYSVPISGEYGLPGGGHAQDFVSRSKNSAGDVIDYYQTITWSNDYGTYNISGAIHAKWATLSQYGSAIDSSDKANVGVADLNIRFQDFKFSKYSGWFGTITEDQSTGETHEVHGAIWQKWKELGDFEWGTPISDEIWVDGSKVRYSDFLATNGTNNVSRLVWVQSTGEVAVRSNIRTYSRPQSLAGAGINLAPQAFGFSDAAATGGTAAAPTGSIDFSAAYQYATDATWADWLSPGTVSAGGLVPYGDAISQASFWDSIHTTMAAAPVSPDTVPAPELVSDDVSSELASPFTPDQLQNRLVELDQAIAQSQQDLQGALDAQAQYLSEQGRIEAAIQAATGLSSDETAPSLADLQASQAQNATALEQAEQQITQLQTQLDLFAIEQALIGSTLAGTDVPRNETADFTGVSFSLTSQDTGDVHQLQIQGQVNPLEVRPEAPGAADGAAARPETPGEVQATTTFTALWDPANDGGIQVSGTLSFDEAGNVHIHFSWGSLEEGTYHTFDGTMTGEAGSYHLEGTAIARPGGVTESMVGDQTQPALVTPGFQQVPDFTNANFTLTDDNGTAHQLQIQTQATEPDGSTTFTGLWDGQNGTGTLAYDDAGNVHMTFNADNYNFDGTISGVAGAFHLDGNLTGVDGNPVHAAGDQTVAQVSQVADFSNVSLTLTDDNGTAHQLQIQIQVVQPDGSAVFVGVWNGQSGTGTLAYDDVGNVHMTFSADDYNFDGTISGAAAAYHIDGTLTVLVSDPVHVAGDQAV